MATIKISLFILISVFTFSSFALSANHDPQYCTYDGSSISMGEMTQSYRFYGTVPMKPTNRSGLFVGQDNLDFGVGRIRIEILLENGKYVVRAKITNGYGTTQLNGSRSAKMPSNFKGSIRYKSEFFGETMIAISKLHPDESIWNMPWAPEFPRDKQVIQNVTLSCFIGPKPIPDFWERFFN